MKLDAADPQLGQPVPPAYEAIDWQAKRIALEVSIEFLPDKFAWSALVSLRLVDKNVLSTLISWRNLWGEWGRRS